MARKKMNINMAIEPSIYTAFQKVCDQWVSGKQKGDVMTAALAAFMALTPEHQGQWIKRIQNARTDDVIDRLTQQLREEQRKHVADDDSANLPTGASALSPKPMRSARELLDAAAAADPEESRRSAAQPAPPAAERRAKSSG